MPNDTVQVHLEKRKKKIHANMLKKKYPPNIAKYNTFTVFTG